MSNSFSLTLPAVDEFLENIRCEKCRSTCDNLQYIGSSCKHAFCWSCVNEICNVRTLAQCPICALPVGIQYVTPCDQMNQLFHSLLKLKEDIVQIGDLEAYNDLLPFLWGDEVPKRSVEEFCATQCADLLIRTSEDSLDIEVNDRSEQCNNASIDMLTTKIKPSTNGSQTVTYHDELLDSPRISQGSAKNSPERSITLFSQLVKEPEFANDCSKQPETTNAEAPQKYVFFPEKPSRSFACGALNLRKTQQDITTATPSAAFLKSSVSLGDHSKAKSTVRRSGGISCRGESFLINSVLFDRPYKMLEALENGADPNEQDNCGFTALFHAACQGNVNLCRILVEHGAIIDAHVGDKCDTALHAAVSSRSLSVVSYLIRSGANRFAKNLKGQYPIDLADEDDDEMREVLSVIPDIDPIEPRVSIRRRRLVFLSPVVAEKYPNAQYFLKEHSALAENFETTTHYVVQLAGKCGAEVTDRILEAILRGMYILNPDWIVACLAKNELIDESPYEISILKREEDVISENSIRKARRNFEKMQPGLFRGCKFYLCPHQFFPLKRSTITRLVGLGGGILLNREPHTDVLSSTQIAPYHAPSVWRTERKLTAYFAIYMPGQSLPHRIQNEKKINIVTPSWLTDCISKFQILFPDERF
ncbi:hypothetical protein AB6A40_000983 [Gnathostoma spinigerum]|uniref:BRCA1-associated RING domain protein 1 n=1 Tax=Gnathostoma spinigerum TaxID=75299 RepID=A0ABD6E7Y1_9BILA